MSEKRKPRLTFLGLAPGESPAVEIVIPLDGEHNELLGDLLKKHFGNAPLMPLTTRRS